MNKKLLPLKNDYVFKRVFGINSHKRVLVCLLNAILNGHPKIESIEFDKTEHVKDREGGKSVRLDIAATTDTGVKVSIEMQCKNTGDIIQRARFYEAKDTKEAIGEGEDYDDIPPRIMIWITDYDATKRKSCVNESVEMFKANGIDPIEIASEKMRKFIIELTKLEMIPKSYVSDMFSIWMQFIRDPESIPPEFLKIEEVNEAMQELQFVSQDKKVRSEYEARQKEINDYNAGVTTALKKGREEGLAEGEQIGIEKGKAEGEKIGEARGIEKGKKEGREEGRAEGAQQAKIATAKNLLNMGLSVEQVAQGTGLSIDEVRSLK